jgi:hypothetical protein
MLSVVSAESKDLPHFSQDMRCGALAPSASVGYIGKEGESANRLWKEFSPPRFVFLLPISYAPATVLNS